MMNNWENNLKSLGECLIYDKYSMNVSCYYISYRYGVKLFKFFYNRSGWLKFS